jgi:hypothetical protein
VANGSGERKSSTGALQVKNKDGILIPYGKTRDYENKYGYHIDSAEFCSLEILFSRVIFPKIWPDVILEGAVFAVKKPYENSGTPEAVMNAVVPYFPYPQKF